MRIASLSMIVRRAPLIAALPLWLLTAGCFTGVESTKRIDLSRDDKKLIAAEAEDTFLNSLEGMSLKNWKSGRPFQIADGKFVFLLDSPGRQFSPTDTSGMAGKKIFYRTTDVRHRPDGSEETLIIFEDGEKTFSLPSGKRPDSAPSEIKSSDLPMLIDLEAVGEARRILAGKRLWIRTSLWYDSTFNHFPGRKFVPVTVLDVRPGTMVFPLLLTLEDEHGRRFMQFMNIGNGSTQSRSFAKLFRLSDPRRNYPHISDEHWSYIQNGHVSIGMTKEECRLSLGNPSFTDSGHDYSSTIDIWKYDDGTFLRFQDGILIELLK